MGLSFVARSDEPAFIDPEDDADEPCANSVLETGAEASVVRRTDQHMLGKAWRPRAHRRRGRRDQDAGARQQPDRRLVLREPEHRAPRQALDESAFCDPRRERCTPPASLAPREEAGGGGEEGHAGASRTDRLDETVMTRAPTWPSTRLLSPRCSDRSHSSGACHHSISSSSMLSSTVSSVWFSTFSMRGLLSAQPRRRLEGGLLRRAVSTHRVRPDRPHRRKDLGAP
jgi:hypothetical protein